MVIVVLIFGFLFGSFLNVVIHRLPDGVSLIRPRSHCPSCKTDIRPADNIPILSYLFLKGRCRHCRVRISIRYPLVEAITGICLAVVYMSYGWSLQFAVYSLLTLFLIPISFIDWDRGLILNRLTVPGFTLGIILVLVLQIENWQSVVGGALGGGALVLLIGWIGKWIFKKDSMGMGDVKLLVMIGVYVGFPDAFICLFYGVFAAGIFIVGGMLLRKIRVGDTIPFGPFIALGSFVHLVIGEVILKWYLSL